MLRLVFHFILCKAIQNYTPYSLLLFINFDVILNLI